MSFDPTRLVHRMRFGTEISDDKVTFRLWAPRQKTVLLRLHGRPARVMERDAEGLHQLTLKAIPPGTRYRFELVDGSQIADPASRFQPDGIEAPSEVIDPAAYRWETADWPGRDWEEAVLYEMHIGTFTQEGTWRAATRRLDHLAALGITAINLMPAAQCFGGFNWGYDGGLWFAPASAYGRPETFKAFVDAAHRRGIMVLLDVVYNHFGPVGNRLADLMPIFTKKYDSPWGEAMNLDGPGSERVRDFILENALYWLTEFNLDGLRFDALHVLEDASNTHFFELLTARCRAAFPHRKIHLVAENSDNEARWLDRDARLVPKFFTAQWNDDLHHLIHAALTREDTGYYADYAHKTGGAQRFARALAEGFAYQGERKPDEDRVAGAPSAGLPPTAFVSYVQNHDQVGNRVLGSRITELAPAQAIRAATALVLLMPQIPMLFMGEEFLARTPFLFFSDMPDEMKLSTERGRQEELHSTPEPDDPASPDAHEAPSPTDPATFRASKLDWKDCDRAKGREGLALMRNLIDLRRHEIIPRLRGTEGFAGAADEIGRFAASVRFRLGDGSGLRLDVNLKDKAQEGFAPPEGRRIWAEGETEGTRLGPWSLRVLLSL